MPYQVHAPVKRQHPHTEENVQDIPWLESWVIFLVKPQSFHVAREMIIINSPSAGKETGTEKKLDTCFFRGGRGDAMLATPGHFLLANASEHH